MYYYQTDLRDTSLNNCTGVLGAAGGDVCENNVRTSGIDNNDKQHLTTFTLGLGARGRMAFSSTYLADTSGDFYDVKKGTPAASPICSWQTSGACNWPAPPTGGNDPTTIDDLWHASVNGRGNYFNATDPKSLSVGLSNALKSIDQVTGAAAAAATSTLNPVAANNFAYVASYTTVKWSGNLEQRTIDTTTGSVSQTAGWCIENIAPPTCIAPYSIVKETSGSSNIYYCSVVATDKNTDGVINAADCTAPDVFTLVGTTNVCRDQIQNTCLGTLPPMVTATSDTRLIKTANSTGNGLVNFDAAYATANPTNFSVAHISGLTQWPAVVTAGLQTTASGTNLINFLRGQNKYEESRSADSADWLFRFRDAVFGDALESQPTYIGAPTFAYLDPGYSAFAANNTSRAGTVFIGANDGMLHAFAASNGVERWAYVPSMIIPNMWKLADTNYSIKHVNYVNGTATISDVCFASCTDAANADWRTILVGGLNAGGRGYFALDVTNPTSPNLLWEFKATSTNNLGYSYGRPVITKKQDGTWVVLISSGYDNGTLDADNVTTNSPTGNGGGYLYVLNALDGTVLSTLPTGVGTAADPSGFAKFEAYSDVIDSNQAGFVYGGDLKGNLWRFNINAPAATNENPLLFATFGATQPITVAPTLAKIKGSRVIIVGTGKYLETPDLSNTSSQSLYAIKDDNKDRSVDGTPFGTLTTPRSTLVQQTIATAGSVRSSGTPVNTVDFNTGRGWFIDFPDSGERANISAKLVQGTLIVPTIVPSNSLCSPGGYGWLNFFNYETGAAVDATNVVSQRTDSTIVGINVIFIDHQPVVDLVTSSNPTPERLILRNRENCVGLACDGVPFIPPPGTPGSFKNQRQTWRELTP
jgi:type IV pilus assembly protein PilY1